MLGTTSLESHLHYIEDILLQITHSHTHTHTDTHTHTHTHTEREKEREREREREKRKFRSNKIISIRRNDGYSNHAVSSIIESCSKPLMPNINKND